MPITKSAKISIRHSARRREVNEKIKKAAKKAIVLFRKNPTKKNLDKAYSEISKAAKKGVFHKNKASRLKSRLTKILNKKGSKKKKIKKASSKKSKKSTKKK